MRLAPDTDTLRRGRRSRRARAFLLLLALVAAGAIGLGAFRAGPTPTLELAPGLTAIGKSTPIAVAAREPRRGISRLEIVLVQRDKVFPLLDETMATPPGWAFWRRGETERRAALTAGKAHQGDLVEGPASLRVTAWPAPAWLRAGEPAKLEAELAVRLTPPSLEVGSSQHYVTQGGAEVVRYRVGVATARDGVAVGERLSPGYQLPGGLAGDRFALFAVPYDQSDALAVRLFAEDDVGNRRELAFVDRFTPLPPEHDDIQLDERFLKKVVPEILAANPGAVDQGSDLPNFLWINRELRRANNLELAGLASGTEPAFLWKAAFLALPGGQVMSSFADSRTYYYGGREVDRQDHLGFDLASVAKADVPAANDGVVRLAKYLGIYGNTVVVDHGFGLMTLYAHLSSLAVKEGDRVGRGQSLGRSGATGLAAGDHLHFSFLLHGMPVRPVEWWDPHWIQDRLKRKLGNALPFGS